MLTQKEIETIVKEIASTYQPEKIYLFGSYAIGKAHSNIDVDLFVIKKTEK
jgi:predicted nucleotidyltransferase